MPAAGTTFGAESVKKCLLLPLRLSSIPLAELPADFRVRALRWAAAFPHCAYFEPNDQPYPHGPFDRLLAVAGAETAATTSLADLAAAETAQPPMRPGFGFVTYDLKNRD